MAVPTLASLHEVPTASCDRTAAEPASAHHHVGAPAATSAAVTRTSSAARSHSAPAPTPMGWWSWSTSGATSRLVGGGGLTLREHQARVPSRGPPSARRLDVVHGLARGRQYPRNQRVRVPHLAGSQLVTAPRQRRCHSHGAQRAVDALRVIGDPHRAPDRLGDVRKGTAGPAPHFVAEEAEPAEPPCSNRPFTNGTALTLSDVPDRPHLDRVGDVMRSQHEGRVVEIRRSPMVSPRRQPLVHASVPAHDVAARAEREPVQVKPRLRPTCDSTHPRQSSTTSHDRRRASRWSSTSR